MHMDTVLVITLNGLYSRESIIALTASTQSKKINLMPEDATRMVGGLLQVFLDPVVIIFLFFTLVALAGKFLRSWIMSCFFILLFGLLSMIVIITIGQLAGFEELIRFYITAQYSFFSVITLSLRDVILIVVIVLGFQFALALHVTKADEFFQKRLFWIPKRRTLHYEMEHTLDTLAKKLKDDEENQ